MPTYRYRAVNLRGRTVRGALAALNERDLQQSLQAIGLELIDCAPQRRRPGLGGNVAVRDLIQLAVHLEEMSRAGVPLLDALADVRDSTARTQLAGIVGQVHRDVAEGKLLSEAFARHPRTFGPVFVALVKAGEETGRLTDCFQQLAKHLRWSEQMAVKVRKALRYPLILVVVVTLVTLFMLAYVVPQVVGFLVGLGQQPPFLTRALIALSDLFTRFWWAILAAGPLLWLTVRTARRMSEDVAFSLDYAVLRLPAAGEVVRKIALSRFAHMFAIMFNAGVDLLSCLATARGLVSNLALGEALDLMRKQVKTGMPLSQAMQTSGEFPALIVRMVRIGEETNTLGRTVENIAEIYDRDTDEAIQAMIQLIEPALTATMGLLLGWIAMAVFGPIYDNLGTLGG